MFIHTNSYYIQLKPVITLHFVTFYADLYYNQLKFTLEGIMGI